MPNRILKESICTSDTIEKLGWFEEVLFYRLIVNCDDYGRFDGRTAVIKNRLFPLKENLTLKNVEIAINKLARAGLVTLYTSDGKPFLFLPTWNEHQTVRAKRSRYPEPENICRQMHAEESKCPRNPIQSESNPNPNPNANAQAKPHRDGAGAAAPFTPPTVEDVGAYCRQRENGIDPQRFVDYYQANGWIQGKGTPIRDWKAMVRTWENRDKAKSTNGPTCTPPSQKDLERFERERERSRRVLAMMKEEEQQGGQGPCEGGKG